LAFKNPSDKTTPIFLNIGKIAFLHLISATKNPNLQAIYILGQSPKLVHEKKDLSLSSAQSSISLCIDSKYGLLGLRHLILEDSPVRFVHLTGR
jgi:hypothetical protein